MLLRVVAMGDSVPQAALLAPGVALITLEGAGHSDAGLKLSVRGRPPAPPYGTVEVGTEHAPARIAALRLPSPAEADATPLLVECGGGDHVALHPSDFEADPL